MHKTNSKSKTIIPYTNSKFEAVIPTEISLELTTINSKLEAANKLRAINSTGNAKRIDPKRDL